MYSPKTHQWKFIQGEKDLTVFQEYLDFPETQNNLSFPIGRSAPAYWVDETRAKLYIYGGEHRRPFSLSKCFRGVLFDMSKD